MTNVFDHWQAQKPALRAALEEQTDPAGAADRVRHALLQTEQNALAEMTDEVLRQQAGVLMSQLKTSVHLVDCQTSAQVWTPRRQADKPAARGGIALWGAALLVSLRWEAIATSRVSLWAGFSRWRRCWQAHGRLCGSDGVPPRRRTRCAWS